MVVIIVIGGGGIWKTNVLIEVKVVVGYYLLMAVSEE